MLVSLIGYFQNPFSFLTGKIGDILDFAFNGHSIIVLAGGVFIIYTAIKEIWHMISLKDLSIDVEDASKGTKSSNCSGHKYSYYEFGVFI